MYEDSKGGGGLLLFYFHAFSKRSQTCKLMNSKNELYGQCSCKTRFLRLQAVGNEGTDEAID